MPPQRFFFCGVFWHKNVKIGCYLLDPQSGLYKPCPGKKRHENLKSEIAIIGTLFTETRSWEPYLQKHVHGIPVMNLTECVHFFF